jgi:hypothetical protein
VVDHLFCWPAFKLSVSIGGRRRVAHHAQSNVSRTPPNQPGWASNQPGLFRLPDNDCASNASSWMYSGCDSRPSCVSGERARTRLSASTGTRARAIQRHVTTTAAPYQSETPRLTRSSYNCSAANHPRANSRTGMFTLSGGIPSRCECSNRTHPGSHAYPTLVQHARAARTGRRYGQCWPNLRSRGGNGSSLPSSTPMYQRSGQWASGWAGGGGQSLRSSGNRSRGTSA